MRKFLFTALTLLVVSTASAREYVSFDLKRLITALETPSGRRASLDIQYLDQILNDLSAHAMYYPPQFDTPQDKQRATQDVGALSKALDMLVDVPTPHPELLARAGHVNSLGHNLDIPGSGEKASAMFQRLLAALPSHPRGNWMYGTFLAGAGKPKEALPYLERALSVGVTHAAYSIGLTYLALGDKEQALKSLEDYERSSPNDGNARKIIDAIRNGRIEMKRAPSTASAVPADESLPPGAIKKGTLANAKLIQDAKVGVAQKVATFGCTQLGGVDPYVLAMPSGTAGQQRWKEMWVVSGCGSKYPVNIEFHEDGPSAANWVIGK